MSRGSIHLASSSCSCDTKSERKDLYENRLGMIPSVSTAGRYLGERRDAQEEEEEEEGKSTKERNDLPRNLRK